MLLLNHNFFYNNILRGIILRKYGLKSSFIIPKIDRLIITIELKDMDENISFNNFLALNILSYIAKTKGACISHTVRYKFGAKHTFIFQSILRKNNKDNFLTFFSLNSFFLLKKKQIDLFMHTNKLHSNLILQINDLSFFAQLPAEYFKWESGLKIEFSCLNILQYPLLINDLTCFIKHINNETIINELLKKNIFYYEIFNNKR
jgi:hypothetical protein